jgi:hypothetical protein
MRALRGILLLVSAGLLAGGCFGGEEEETIDASALSITGLSSTELMVGETVYVAGSNFLKQNEGRTELVFEGMYKRDDGIFEDVEFVVSPVYDGEFIEDGEVGVVPVEAGTNLLRWSRFGPFKVPFTAEGNVAGTFKGTLSARNVAHDGTVLEQSNATDVTIRVRPSIIIRKLEPFIGFDVDGEPIMAECGSPALRAINNLPYVLEVEAVGFQPEYFNYEFSGVNGASQQAVKYSHKMDLAGEQVTDSIGDPDSGQYLVFNAVPEDESFYYATIRVTAPIKDGTGDFVETALPISVHRPMEFHLGQSESRVAQYYEPVPVSACIPGGINTQVTYSESESEARQKGVSVSLSKSWSQDQGVSQAESWSEGVSQSTTIQQAETQGWSHSESETAAETYGVSYNHSDSQSASYESNDGENYGWSYNEGTTNSEMEAQMGEVYGEVSGSVSTEVSAEGSVPGFAKVGGKVGTTVGASVGGKTGQTSGKTMGTSSNSGSNMSSSHSQSEGFGSSSTDSTGESVGESYALTSQDAINGSTQQSEANTNSKVYTLGGTGTMSESVSQGEQETWQETWVTTNTISTSMSTSTKIPNKQYGVWYRQTVRNVRQAQVYSHNLCGVRELMGSLTFNDWTWAPALALGKECGGSVKPMHSFPPAECVIPPCD